MPALARTHKMALEEAARSARYAFLARLARKIGASTIAVGHHVAQPSIADGLQAVRNGDVQCGAVVGFVALVVLAGVPHAGA